jgi:hypothetical protein
MVKPADLAGVTLHDGIAEGHLAIAADNYCVAATNGNDGCAMKGVHWMFGMMVRE